MKQKILFFGSGTYTIPIIEVLKKHNLILIVTTEKEGSYINYLKKQNIPFVSSTLKNKKDIGKIFNYKPTMAVLASYGAIIPKLIINNYNLSILNIHPSLLPIYKGPSPVQTAILNGDKITGVTIIKLDEQVDHGPIAMQKKVSLTGQETSESLKKDLFLVGSKMIDDLLKKIEKGEEIKFQDQDHKKEIFTSKVKRTNGFIDSNNPPDKNIITRMIRAFYPWPGVWTEAFLYNKKRRIKLLPNNKIQVEGKKVMAYKEFENGYQKEGKDLLVKLSLY